MESSSSEDEESDEEVDPDSLTLDGDFMAQMAKNRGANVQNPALAYTSIWNGVRV